MDAVRMIMEAECKCEHGNITVGECAKILAPLHDVEPVVRCKDCKHRDPEDKKCDCGHDIHWQLPRPDNWFCADGER